MNKEHYKQRLKDLPYPKDFGAILIQAGKDPTISKEDYIELTGTTGKAIVEYYRELAKEEKQLTIKELFIKEIEETSSSDKIMEILSRAVLSNLWSQELIEIQFAAIKKLRDMIVRY